MFRLARGLDRIAAVGHVSECLITYTVKHLIPNPRHPVGGVGDDLYPLLGVARSDHAVSETVDETPAEECGVVRIRIVGYDRAHKRRVRRYQ